MSNILPGHVRAFQMIRTPLYDNIFLESCTINGQPGVAIILADQVSETHIGIMPLFVAITDWMKIDFPGMEKGERGGGGPKNPKRNSGDKYAPLKPEPK